MRCPQGPPPGAVPHRRRAGLSSCQELDAPMVAPATRSSHRSRRRTRTTPDPAPRRRSLAELTHRRSSENDHVMSKTHFAVPRRSPRPRGARPAAADTYAVRQGPHERRLPGQAISYTSVSGKFTDFTGTIQMDRAKPEARRSSSRSRRRASTPSEPGRDQHLRSADFFDVANNPTITFKSTSVKANGKDSWSSRATSRCTA